METLEVHLKFTREQRRLMNIGQLAQSLATQVRVRWRGWGGTGMIRPRLFATRRTAAEHFASEHPARGQ